MLQVFPSRIFTLIAESGEVVLHSSNFASSWYPEFGNKKQILSQVTDLRKASGGSGQGVGVPCCHVTGKKTTPLRSHQGLGEKEVGRQLPTGSRLLKATASYEPAASFPGLLRNQILCSVFPEVLINFINSSLPSQATSLWVLVAVFNVPAHLSSVSS